jgi:glyoxylase-like metal-dependent hydrolase (beta-lactamase superfamily II)
VYLSLCVDYACVSFNLFCCIPYHLAHILCHAFVLIVLIVLIVTVVTVVAVDVSVFDTGRVIHTPGHTPGSTSFYFEAGKLLLSGDTLFRGSVGRTDLPGGDSKKLVKSIREQLYVLPHDTVVVSGHGPETSIGHECLHNAVVRAKM